MLMLKGDIQQSENSPVIVEWTGTGVIIVALGLGIGLNALVGVLVWLLGEMQATKKSS